MELKGSMSAFFQLREAFERYGKFAFGADWTGQEVALEQKYLSISESWNPEDHAEQRFKRVWIDLFEDLYCGRVSTFGLRESGEQHDVPDYVWKDVRQKSIFVIEGYVLLRDDNAEDRIRVQIERAPLLARLRERWSAARPVPPAGDAVRLPGIRRDRVAR